VPRERFVPEVLAQQGLESVYSDQAFVTKADPGGLPLSSSSQPALMAKMLELLDLHPGQRVLEIGAGTGYNAALLAQLVGSGGKVTSIDVDKDLARRARGALKDAGYKASVVVGDGRGGWPDAAPYDRIIVTACADEIPRPWLEQLEDGGRLELPLRLDPDRAAIQVIPVFERRGDRLRSTALTWGGFMPLHGGDGGWRHPPASLSASRSGAGTHSSLVSIAGPAVAGLSRSAARELLGSVLTTNERPRAHGLVAMNSAHPPLLLIYLLLKIPAARRLALHADGRLGVGVIHRSTRSLAFVSVPSPWMGQPEGRRRRAPWRLDAYGGDAAASELERLLANWEAMQRDGRRTLRITAHGRRDPLRLRFGWSRPPG
jgi:protein-L-isoaspartate(D-aspartate) O-methyltransferase